MISLDADTLLVLEHEGCEALYARTGHPLVIQVDDDVLTTLTAEEVLQTPFTPGLGIGLHTVVIDVRGDVHQVLERTQSGAGVETPVLTGVAVSEDCVDDVHQRCVSGFPHAPMVGPRSQKCSGDAR